MTLCSSPVSHILRSTIDDDQARDNFTNWSVCMKNYLLGQDLWDVVEASSKPKPEDSGADLKTWRKKNAVALLAIQNSCEPDILSQIREITSAKVAWDTLAKIYEPEPPTYNSGQPAMSEEHRSLAINPIDLDEVKELQSSTTRQDDSSPLGSDAGVQNNEYLQFQPLYKAMKKGDWAGVKNFIELKPGVLKAKITPIGMTVLHVACNSGHVNIVKKLVQLMTEEDLEIKNQFGETALFVVAKAGITEIAKCMIQQNRNLTSIKDNGGDLPVTVASMYGHRDMTRYLYSVSPIELLFPENGNQGPQLLISSMFGRIYDVALDLLRRCPKLTTAKTSRGTIPLVRLASMPFAFPSGSQLTFWQRWIYSCIHVQLPTASSEVHIHLPRNEKSERDDIIQLPVSGQLRRLVSNILKSIGIGILHSLYKEIYEMKWIHLHTLELLRCMCEEISTSSLEETYMHAQCDALFEATKYGIIEFIIEMSKVDLEINLGSIFRSAIVHRQEKICSLLYGLDTSSHQCIASVDRSNNNMLHLAGMLAHTSQLARISGAALQMQRERKWFKEVKSILPHMFQEYSNDDNETPRQVFTRNHEKLRKEGEKWMKETATSYTVVGALIITIMFAAAFTVPGGNNQDTGFPLFVKKKSFTVFIMSDAISLFASSSSLLMFLGIITSRYEEDDFLKSLPTKLIIGLSTLYFSIIAMIVAFVAALFIVLEGHSWITIPIGWLASVPITLFILLQFRLLVEIFMSTYGPSIFNRKMKPWL